MLSVRQQLYKKNRLEGKSCETSAVLAGYSVKYARAFAYKIESLAKLGMSDALSRAGLTDDYLAEKAKERIEKNSGVTGLGYFQAVCKMKGHLFERPVNDNSNHQSLTIIVNSPEAALRAKEEHVANASGTTVQNGHIRLDA